MIYLKILDLELVKWIIIVLIGLIGLWVEIVLTGLKGQNCVNGFN